MPHSTEHAELERELLIDDDGLQIDPATGEVVTDPLEIQTKDLPDVARRLRAIENRIRIIQEFEQQEHERIARACAKKVGSFEITRQFYMTRAEQLLAETGQKEIDYPGLGKFRFGTTRESVVTTAWDEMSDKDKRRYHINHQMIFRDPSRKDLLDRISPDKREIMKRLKSGALEPDVFRLSDKEPVFQFKPED